MAKKLAEALSTVAGMLGVAQELIIFQDADESLIRIDQVTSQWQNATHYYQQKFESFWSVSGQDGRSLHQRVVGSEQLIQQLNIPTELAYMFEYKNQQVRFNPKEASWVSNDVFEHRVGIINLKGERVGEARVPAGWVLTSKVLNGDTVLLLPQKLPTEVSPNLDIMLLSLETGATEALSMELPNGPVASMTNIVLQDGRFLSGMNHDGMRVRLIRVDIEQQVVLKDQSFTAEELHQQLPITSTGFWSIGNMFSVTADESLVMLSNQAIGLQFFHYVLVDSEGQVLDHLSLDGLRGITASNIYNDQVLLEVDPTLTTTVNTTFGTAPEKKLVKIYKMSDGKFELLDEFTTQYSNNIEIVGDGMLPEHEFAYWDTAGYTFLIVAPFLLHVVLKVLRESRE